MSRKIRSPGTKRYKLNGPVSDKMWHELKTGMLPLSMPPPPLLPEAGFGVDCPVQDTVVDVPDFAQPMPLFGVEGGEPAEDGMAVDFAPVEVTYPGSVNGASLYSVDTQSDISVDSAGDDGDYLPAAHLHTTLLATSHPATTSQRSPARAASQSPMKPRKPVSHDNKDGAKRVRAPTSKGSPPPKRWTPTKAHGGTAPHSGPAIAARLRDALLKGSHEAPPAGSRAAPLERPGETPTAGPNEVLPAGLGDALPANPIAPPEGPTAALPAPPPEALPTIPHATMCLACAAYYLSRQALQRHLRYYCPWGPDVHGARAVAAGLAEPEGSKLGAFMLDAVGGARLEKAIAVLEGMGGGSAAAAAVGKQDACPQTTMPSAG